MPAKYKVSAGLLGMNGNDQLLVLLSKPEKEGAVMDESNIDGELCGVQSGGGVRTPLKFGVNRRPLAGVREGRDDVSSIGEPNRTLGKVVREKPPSRIVTVQPK